MPALDEMSHREFIAALMRGDPGTFKGGYTADNAVKALAERRNLTNEALIENLLVWADGYEEGLEEGRGGGAG